MPLTKTCLICGTTFVTQDKRQKFCSRACHTENQRRIFRNRVTLTCDYCGKPYEQTPSLQQSSRFCSKSCKAAARTRDGHVRCTCKVCGKEFERLASRTGDYCSYTCMGLYHRERVTLTCSVCGKPYDVIPSHVEESRYCSYACKHQGWAETVRKYIGKRGPTTIETLVRDALNQLELCYQAEQPVGPYVVDFLLPDHNIALEVDGDYWHSLPASVARDKRKDRYLRHCGYTVIRLSETDITTSSSVADLVVARLRL